MSFQKEWGRVWNCRLEEPLLECCKQRLMGHPSGSLEDRDAERNASSKGPAHVIPKQIKDSIGDWARKPFV